MSIRLERKKSDEKIVLTIDNISVGTNLIDISQKGAGLIAPKTIIKFICVNKKVNIIYKGKSIKAVIKNIAKFNGGFRTGVEFDEALFLL